MTSRVFILAVLLAGCGDEREDEPEATSLATLDGTGTGIDTIETMNTSNDTGKLDVAGGSVTDSDSGPGDDGPCGCKDVLDGIYVLNSDSPPSVWFFDPPANQFSQVGVLGCQVPLGWVANSMAIDRQGYAWVNYYEQVSQSGKMFRAPLSDLSQCEDLGYVNPAGNWWLLGMGYAVVNPQSSCDELFIYKSDRYLEYPNFGPGGALLGQYDQATNTVQPIGATDYPVGELTGTGDGRLFTFGPVDSQLAVLVNLDKDTGAELEHTDLDGLDITNAFAFAFWGGDVYFFTETAPLSGVSQVTRLDHDGNEGGGLSIYNANTGIHIPGAGVSTCASFTPPG